MNRTIKLTCDLADVSHSLGLEGGKRISFFRADCVRFEFDFSGKPEGAEKLRVLAKKYYGFGHVAAEPVFAKEAEIKAENEEWKTVEFDSLETAAPAGYYLLSVIFVGDGGNILTSASGLVDIVENGSDAHFQPPQNFRDEIFAAAERAAAALASSRALLAEMKEVESGFVQGEVRMVDGKLYIQSDAGSFHKLICAVVNKRPTLTVEQKATILE